MPSVEGEVPSKEEVEKMEGYSHLASYFPDDPSSLDTIILIGRDNISLFKNAKTLEVDGSDLMAAKMKLGWTMLGPKQRLDKKLSSHELISHNP